MIANNIYMTIRRACCLVVVLSLQTISPAFADKTNPIIETSGDVYASPKVVPKAAIASAHPLATQAGVEILKQGGNAFDAAIAVTATLAVVEPYSSGLGGGGFYLLHQVKNGRAIKDQVMEDQGIKNRYVMLDARERAPLMAHKDLYLDGDGSVIAGASINGALSAGIPGIPAALVHLSEQYGQLKLSQSLAPAIHYARQGFMVDEFYQRMVSFRLKALQNNAEADRIFLQDGGIPKLEHRIVQHDLAKTLERIASLGFSGFYKNETARQLVKDVRANGGIWTLKDLADYKVKERAPDVTFYKGMKLVSASLPSSGGIVLSEILGMLAQFDIEAMDKAQRIHTIVETMRRAYRDRAEYMGDPDFVEVPVDYLISNEYIQSLASSIEKNHATSSSALKSVAQPSGSGTDTTHFSIVDDEGNKVSATLSINYPFGSCFVAKGTGILLNDEMDDFASKPGVPNVYGLVGSHANAIEPGKRMLSSMTPSIAETKNRIAIIGTPGGSRIITMVLLGVLDFYENKSADEIVNAGRFHHQYLPDEIAYEPGVLGSKSLDTLHGYGHKTKVLDQQYGNMQVIVIDKKTSQIEAASDGRGVGEAEVIY